VVGLFILVLCLNTGVQNTLKQDIAYIDRVNPISDERQEDTPQPQFTLRQTSELRLFLTGLVRVYQIVISPQGPPACNFTVTCSNFMSQAVEKHGIIHGLLMASDRLCRCTRGGRAYYTIDKRTRRAIDYPVETYYLYTDKRLQRQN
jgi:putative membrane protein insertion efficiency factor